MHLVIQSYIKMISKHPEGPYLPFDYTGKIPRNT